VTLLTFLLVALSMLLTSGCTAALAASSDPALLAPDLQAVEHGDSGLGSIRSEGDPPADAREGPLATNPAASFSWDDFPTFPLPVGVPAPLGPATFASGFRDPLPLTPVWNPPGPKQVGLQVGHWLTFNTPEELRRLGPGSSAGGWAEWEVNLLVAQAAARFLEEAGVQVDLLPTTIPVRYRAHAFLSIHADGDTAGAFRGYKIARSGFSSVPEIDDVFVRALYDEYGAATGMPRDSDAHISRRMTYYYAFNTRRYHHAIDIGTPSAIIEAGFMTSAVDRAFLTGQPDVAGRGIANGILKFLGLELGARTA
jgi:N-acetylmuramoyl-L-alanine amidase